MKNHVVPISLFILFLMSTAVNGLMAQEADRSGERAKTIINKSYAAHGGVYSTDSLKIAFKFTNKHRINEGQSRRAEAPFEEYYYQDEVWIDKPAKREFYKNTATLAGGFSYDNVTFLNNGKGYDINNKYKNYAEINSLPNPRQLLCNYILKSAKEDLTKVKFIGEKMLSGKKMLLLLVDTIQVYINPDNYLVERIERPVYEPVYRKGMLSIDFKDYVRAGKIMVPQKYISTKTNEVYGVVTNTFLFSDIQTRFEIPESKCIVPDHYTHRTVNPKDCAAQKLADGIYFIENVDGPGGAYHVIAAEFSNFVLVTEAPLDGEIIKRITRKVKELFPEKPVRYVVQSHHHYDHIGGILQYVSDGVTIVISKDASGLVYKMAKAYSSQTGNVYPAPKIETVKDKWTIKDRLNECVVYNISNPHSKELLVTYFPKQKILYQADMPLDEFRNLPAGVAFVKTIKELKIDIRTIAGTHQKILNEKEVAELLGKSN